MYSRDTVVQKSKREHYQKNDENNALRTIINKVPVMPKKCLGTTWASHLLLDSSGGRANSLWLSTENPELPSRENRLS